MASTLDIFFLWTIDIVSLCRLISTGVAGELYSPETMIMSRVSPFAIIISETEEEWNWYMKKFIICQHFFIYAPNLFKLILNPISLLVQDLFNSSPFMHSMDDFEMFGGGAFPSGSGQRTRRSQQTCRTVTQKVGNKMTTYTRCSWCRTAREKKLLYTMSISRLL